jgi:hypothetical protein
VFPQDVDGTQEEISKGGHPALKKRYNGWLEQAESSIANARDRDSCAWAKDPRHGKNSGARDADEALEVSRNGWDVSRKREQGQSKQFMRQLVGAQGFNRARFWGLGAQKRATSLWD